MKRFIWTQYLRNLISTKARRHQRSDSRRFRLETLEDRLSPAVYIWSGSGADNRWSTGANWVGNVAPTGSAVTLDSLVFPSSAATRNAFNDLPISGSTAPVFNSITISGNDFIIHGNSLTLGDPTVTGSGSILVNAGVLRADIQLPVTVGGAGGSKQFITVGSGADLTISGALSGTTGVELTKQDTGTLVLTADNSAFTGPITIDNTGGVLQVRHRLALGDTTSPTRVGTNAQLQVSNVAGVIPESLILNGPGISNDGAILNVTGNNTWGGTVALDSNSTFGSNADSLTFTNTISDLGSGYSITKEGASRVIFSGANTYRGLTTINNGTLVAQNPLALGVGGTNSNKTLVNQTLTKVGTLQIDDPTGVGFTVLNEWVELNGNGVNNNGALNNLRGNNTWANRVILGSPAPNGSDIQIGVAAGTELLVSGVVSSPNGSYNLTKVQQGRLIFNNSNTYSNGAFGATFVSEGILTGRDSRAFNTNNIVVAGGAALEYQVDTGFDAFNRNLGADSVTGVPNRLQFSNLVGIQGNGFNGAGGALRSVSGINTQTGDVQLQNSAAIGVDPDPFASNSNSYFTSDYSLTVSGQISGAATLIKLGTGQLILPRANSYTNQTRIQQGWVTIRDAGAFGPLGVGSDTIQFGVIVSAGASLHLKPNAGQSINLIKPLTLSGTGITHPFALINQKGALVSLGGDNTIGGSNTSRKSDIVLNGVAGIGVEMPDTAVSPTSSLTITSSVADGTSAGGINKLGSRRLILQGDGTYSGANTISEGVLRVQNSQALGVASTGTANAGNADTYTTSTTTINRGIAELQSIRIVGTPGTYTLTFNGETTTPISTTASAAQVAAALNALPGVVAASGLISVTQSGNTYMVSFAGGLLGDNQPQMIANVSGTVSVQVATVMNGDGAGIELGQSIDWLNGGVVTGMNIWYERLVLNSKGNTQFDPTPGDAASALVTLAGDHMWRGPLTLRDSASFQISSGTRLTLFSTIDDSSNPIASGSNLLVTGGGKLSLGGSNTYRGTTFINQGTLIIENSQALGGAGVAQVQDVVLGGLPTGTFTLTFNGQTTAPLPATATALQVAQALNNLSTIQGVGGQVVVSQNMNVYTVTFVGSFLGFVVNTPLTGTGSGGTTVTTSTTTQGAGGTIVADGASLQLMGNLAVSGEPLIVQGRGTSNLTNIPLGWFNEGPAPANGWNGAGNQAVTGRVTGIVIDPSDNNVIYVATGTGGVWKTKNRGQTWLPLFDQVNGNAEVQTITVGGTAGTFTITFNGQTTAPLAWNATAEEVQLALNNLPSIGGVYGLVSVTKSGSVFTVGFGGLLRGVDVPLMTVANTGGAGAAVALVGDGIPVDVAMYIGTMTPRTTDNNADGVPDVLDAIYIGTGETNNSPDSFYGTGIYRSTDGGVNWTLVTGEQKQTVKVWGTTPGGTFTMTLEGETTAPLPYDDTAANVKAALDGLPKVSASGSTSNVVLSRQQEVQRVTITGSAGNFILGYGADSIAAQAYNVSAANLQTALNALPSLQAAGLSVSVSLAGQTYTITFNYSGTSTEYDLPLLTTDGGTGGATVAVTEVTPGARVFDITWNGTYAQREVGTIVAAGTAGASASAALSGLYNPFVGKGISKIIVDTRSNDTLYVAVGDGGVGRNEVQRVTPTVSTGQTFQLRFTGLDANGQQVTLTTAPITRDANRTTTASNIQTALNALGNIGGAGGNVVVTAPGFGNNYQVTFGGVLAQTNVLLLDGTNLGANTTTVTEGGNGKVVNGTSGGAGIWRLMVPNEEQILTVTGTDGKFRLTFNGRTTGDLDYNATASAVQSALNTLTSIGGITSYVQVSQTNNTYRITFNGGLGGTDQPLITVANASGTANGTVRVFKDGGGTRTFFNMTAVTSDKRSSVATTNQVAPAQDANYTGSPSKTANPPRTPGPDDDYRVQFPQTSATWSDVVLIYTDTNNTPTNLPVGPARPVLYAALGTSSGSINNGVFWSKTVTSENPQWYLGDPGGSPFQSPAVEPGGTVVDARSGSEFPMGQFAVPNPSPTGSAPIPEVPFNGNIKIAAVAGTYLSTSTVYATVSNPQGGLRGVYRTTTGGQSWGAVGATLPNFLSSQGAFANAITIDPRNGQEVRWGGYESDSNTHDWNIIGSSSGGSNWFNLSVQNGNGPHAGVHFLTYDYAGRLYAGTDGGIWVLEGGNWVNLNGNLNVSQVNGVASHPNDLGIVYAGMQQNGTASFNNSLGWTVTDSFGGGQIRIDPKNPQNLYHIQPRQGQTALVRKSTNGGVSWTPITPAGNTNRTDLPLVLDTIDPRRVLVGSQYLNNGTLFSIHESNDRGNSWTQLLAPVATAVDLAISTYQGPFVSDPDFTLVTDKGANTYDPDTIYVTNGDSVYITKNHGVTWTDRTTDLSGLGGIRDLEVDPRNRDVVYAVRNVFGGGKIFVTLDAGQTWTDISTNLPDLPVWKVVLDPRTGDLYLGTDRGVFLRPAGSTQWEEFGAGLPNVQVRDLELNQNTNTLRAGTYGRGVFLLYLDDRSSNAGALRAVSGSSSWSGPVQLLGSVANNDVYISANGTQSLQNGIATASLNIVGSIRDLTPPGTNPTLVKIGQGDVILSGVNAYRGVTEVREGALVIQNARALGDSSPAANTIVTAGAVLELQSDLELEPVTLNGDGILFNDRYTGALRNRSNNNTYTGVLTLATNSTIGVDSNSSLTIGSRPGVLAGTGTITESGGSRQLTKALTGTLILGSANSYNGLTRVFAGALQVRHANALGGVAQGTQVFDGAQLQLQEPSTGNPVVVVNEPLTLSGTGINETGALLNLGGNNQWVGGAVTFNSNPVLLVPSGTPATTPPTTIAIGVDKSTDTLTIDAVIGQTGGTFGLWKVGPGRATLVRANTYGGFTTITDGALRIQNSGSLGTNGSAATGTRVVGSGAALEIDGSIAPVNVGNENLFLNGTGINGTGALLNINNTNSWAGPITLESNTSMGADAGTRLNITGAVSDPTPLIVPAASLTKVGTGTVSLRTANPYGGYTYVNEGILNISNAGALGTTAAELQQIVLNASGTVGTYTLTFNGETTAPLPYNIPANGGVGPTASVQNALNALASINGVSGSVTVTGTFGTNFQVTFGGSLLRRNVTPILAVGFNGVNPVVTTLRDGPEGTIVASGATLQVENSTIVSTEDLTLSGQGFTNLGALHSAAGSNSWFGPLHLAADTFIGAAGGSTVSLGTGIDEIGGSWDLTKVGTGIVGFAGAASNTYTGLTQVNEGTLLLNKSSSAVAVPSDLRIGDTVTGQGIVQWQDSNQMVDGATITVENDGLLDIMPGLAETVATLKVIDGDAQLDMSSDLTISALEMTGGKISIDIFGSLNLLGDVTATSSATEEALITGAGSVDLGTQTRTLAVANGPQSSDLHIVAPIVGTGTVGIIKTGPGRLELDGTSTYSGPTSILVGEVQVDGSIGAVELEGGTLAGIGQVGAITGDTGGTTAAVGTVAPGDSGTGILSTNGDVRWSSTTTYTVELNGTTPGSGHDQLQVTGDIYLSDLNGAASLNALIGPLVVVGNSFTIIQTTGTVFGQFVQGTTTFIDGRKYQIQYNTNSVVLTRIKSDVNMTLTPSNNPSVYGEQVTYTVTVTPEAGSGSVPSGNQLQITFNGTTYPAVSVGSGTVVFDPQVLTGAPLPVGNHTVSVSYLGDPDFNSKSIPTPNPLIQVVDKANTSISVAASPTTPVYGQQVTISAAINPVAPGGQVSGSALPSGSLLDATFTIDGNTYSATRFVGNIAELDINFLGAGSHLVSVSYAGDGNYNGSSTTSDFTLIIDQATTDVTVGVTANPIYRGQQVTINATVAPVAPGSGTPTGVVNFYLNSITTQNYLGQDILTLIDGGLASLTTSTLPAGNHQIIAVYEGSNDFVTDSGSTALTVLPGQTTTTLVTSASPSVFGQSVTFTATASSVIPANGTPQGQVIFSIDGLLYPRVVVDANGVATLTLDNLSLGTHTVVATYSDPNLPDQNDRWAPSSDTETQVVNQAGTTLTLTSLTNPSVAGQFVNFRVNVAANSPGSGVPTGSVTFFVNSVQFGSPVNLVSGVASSPQIPFAAAGSYIVSAQYSGSTNYLGDSDQLTQVVRAVSAVTVTTTPTQVNRGESVTLRAAVAPVSPSTGIATGNVRFYYNSVIPTNLIGSYTLQLADNGIASISTSTLPAGIHTIIAVYDGDTGFIPGQGQTLTALTVRPAVTTTAVTSSALPSKFGQAVTFEATVASVLGANGTPQGQVIFRINGISQPRIFLDGSGKASLTLSNLPAGANSVEAIYSDPNLPDVNDRWATSNFVLTQQVEKAGTTTTLVNQLGVSVVGEPVPFQATVTAVAPGVGIPTGTVTFLVNGTPRGTVALDNGVAVLPITFTSAGTNFNVTARFNEATNFSTSVSAPALRHTVLANMTVTTLARSANPSVFGQQVAFTATVRGGTYTGPKNKIPTGSVTFLVNGVVKATVALNTNGQAVYRQALGVGDHTIEARYNQTASFRGSNVVVNHRTNKAGSKTVLTSNRVPAYIGQSSVVTATVSAAAPGGGVPQGTITFVVDGAAQTPITLVNGKASINLGVLSLGNHSITATYSGGDNHTGSAGGFTQQVRNPTKVTASASPASILTPFTITAFTRGADNSVATGYNGPGTITLIGRPAGATYTGPTSITFTNGRVDIAGLVVSLVGKYTFRIQTNGIFVDLVVTVSGRVL
ncbi:MAG: Ig-like domain repeat protein [Gemmataceae bacterium]